MIHLSMEKYKGFSHDYSEDFAAFLGNFTICKSASCSLCGRACSSPNPGGGEREKTGRNVYKMMKIWYHDVAF